MVGTVFLLRCVSMLITSLSVPGHHLQCQNKVIMSPQPGGCRDILLLVWIPLGIWGEAELIFRIWGAKEKYFQGAEEFS